MELICRKPRWHEGGIWVLGLSNLVEDTYICHSPQSFGNIHLLAHPHGPSDIGVLD